MKKLILLKLLFLFISLSTLAQNINIQKETFVYATKDRIELKLDKYNINDSLENKPCIIFMFGGGFVSGERDNKDYLEYFDFLANNGIVVLSIDYRKGLKDIKSSKILENVEEDFVKIFSHTLDFATEDLLDATVFALKHADEWNIDTQKIIISGSSAGAISVLQGEYVVANELEVSKRLPEGFRYAGVISFAGAIFSQYGELQWKNNPSPMLLFHGSADKNVPYNAVELGYLGFYGSKFIANQLARLEVPYYFYDEIYAGHELANTPMHEHLDLILDFIDKQIINDKGLRIHINVNVNGRVPVNTNFSIKDYLSTNFK